jgi:hypothetical protein
MKNLWRCQVINPDEQSTLVYRQPQPERLLKISDNLEGE